MSTLTTPPILFFVLGMLAAALRTGLKVPHPIPKLLSLYLLFAIGFKGGMSLSRTGPSGEMAAAIGAGVVLSALLPLVAYAALRRHVGAMNAGAVAATYGSISAVTFITASAVLRELGVPQSGYMVAVMAVMESPAIVVGVLLARRGAAREAGSEGPSIRWGHLLHESFLNGPVFLLLGSMAVGVLSGEKGAALLAPFAQDMFTGALCFFCWTWGSWRAAAAGDRTRGRGVRGVRGGRALLQGRDGPARREGAGHVRRGRALLLTLLAGSASYIAAPAALKLLSRRPTPGCT